MNTSFALRTLPSALLSLGLCACASGGTIEPVAGTVSIGAVRETIAVKTHDDAADDPAIWRNAADPSSSLIVATDKKAGLYVYGLDGQVRDFAPSSRLNNVDLRGDVKIAGVETVLVAASDRADEAHSRLALYALSPQTAKLTELANLPAGNGEAYGLCLYRRANDRALFAFVVEKSGRIIQLQVDVSAAQPAASVVRELQLASQSEGCVVDDRTGMLYVGEEDVGIWRFDASPTGATRGELFAKVDKRMLVDDVEGLALAPVGERGGYLVASSQGDSSYAVYALEDGAPVGRFRITDNGKGVDGTSETDGIELALGDFGPDFPQGLFIAQDGDNAPEAQNFKLLSWVDVVQGLRLEMEPAR
ncbi:phytase [Hydrocarboniphaga effusa]|uniref:phytase n=1 Tax=Hydrocarboniphaga effusa TaxID=243629 RepID=UPI00398C20EE